MFKGKLDALVICHGAFSIIDVTQSQTILNDLDIFYNINARSAFHILSLCVPFLKLTQGAVVGVSAQTADIPVKYNVLNGLSKGLFNAMLRQAALELAPLGIRVNGVAPGMVKTKHIKSSEMSNNDLNQVFQDNEIKYPLNRRVINKEEVAQVLLFLLTDHASFVTGQIITVDNGYSVNHSLGFTITDG